jgi:hypothetical protein
MNLTPEQIGLWLSMLGIAIWGGIVSYYRKVQKGLQHTWMRLGGEIATSALAGLGVGVLCNEGGFSMAWSLAFAGIAGHMGSTVFDIGEDILKAVLWKLGSVDRREPGQPPARRDADRNPD